jgi:hypothetical protein
MRPYINIETTDNYIIREFSQDIDELDLIWHMDDEDRTIIAIEETDWMFQFDDELPMPLNSPISIPRHKVHRVIKGSGNLKLKITKHFSKIL